MGVGVPGTLCVFIALWAMPGSARAGFCTSDPPVPDSRHDFQFFAGYSPAAATLIGTTTDRRFALAGFSYGYRCWAWRHASLSYNAGLMPAAILIEPSHSVYGFAVMPVGFTLEFRPGSSLRPFAESTGGVIASTEPIPQTGPDATALNFIFTLGGGLRWQPRRGHHALSIGYKFLHISNAYTTDFNPGVDNNVIYAGFSILR
jgi:hypothetical protein